MHKRTSWFKVIDVYTGHHENISSQTGPIADDYQSCKNVSSPGCRTLPEKEICRAIEDLGSFPTTLPDMILSSFFYVMRHISENKSGGRPQWQ